MKWSCVDAGHTKITDIYSLSMSTCVQPVWQCYGKWTPVDSLLSLFTPFVFVPVAVKLTGALLAMNSQEKEHGKSWGPHSWHCHSLRHSSSFATVFFVFFSVLYPTTLSQLNRLRKSVYMCVYLCICVFLGKATPSHSGAPVARHHCHLWWQLCSKPNIIPNLFHLVILVL